MILWILHLLVSWHYKVPSVFFYFSTRMILSAITALLLTVFLGPYFIKKLYELKIGQTIRSVEEVPLLAELHGKKKDTPTMGGILILFSISCSLLLWMDFASVFTWILFVVTGVLGFLGGRDDYLKLKYKNSKGVSPRYKMACQVGLSAAISAYLLFFSQSPLQSSMELFYLPFVKDPVLIFSGAWKMVLFFFFIFVITGTSNAVNLTDGLDGLASGCVIMTSLVLALFAFFSNHIELSRYLNILYIENSGEIAVYLTALAGACLGFLWYNGYPAQVFMGDTGSLALGGVLGISSVLLRKEVLLVFAGAIFVAEALSVIIQVLSFRYRNRKRVFLCAPLHHHFEYKGWPETKVVLRFWIIGLLFALIAVSSLKFQ